MTKQVYDLIVVGAGSAGLTAAELAAKMGASVALVDKQAENMGGECLHAGCVPSKSLIHAAKQPKATWKSVQTHIKKTVAAIQEAHDNPDVYHNLGVAMFFGDVQLQAGRQIKVGKQVLRYKKLLVATGSSPRIPDIAGLKEAGFETNETIFYRKTAPKSLAIIGGGPIAIELAFAFLRLGIETHIIEHNPHLLHIIDPEAAEAVHSALIEAGALVHTSAGIVSVSVKSAKKELSVRHGEETSVIRVSDILVAAGRQANVPKGLTEQGVTLENGMVVVNSRWQTSNSSIYAAGDCTNFGRNFTHVAGTAAAHAVSHALYGVRNKQDLRNQPYVFFAEPEVAQVGPTVAELERNDVWHLVHQLPFKAIDKALADNSEGFLKVSVTQSGRILGATVVGENAGELIGYFSMALDKNMKIYELANFPLPYPTLSFGIKELAYRAQLEMLADKKTFLGLVRKITLR